MMKTYYTLSIIALLLATLFFTRCKPTEVITSKSGTQLWAENCVRCHYAPSAVDFNDHEWDVIGMHMRIRAQITKTEGEKIIEFLKRTN